MSQTRYVDFRHTGFLAYDVTTVVSLKFLMDAACELTDGAEDHWRSKPIQNWRVKSVSSEFSFYLDDSCSPTLADTVV
jgi:hypothetical protein